MKPEQSPSRGYGQAVGRLAVSHALRITAAYVAFAALWVYYSDWALGKLTADPERLTHWGTFKGFVFVAVTGALLYSLLHRTFASMRRSQESLRESEEHFRGLVEQTFVGACVVQDRRIAYANPQFAAIFGYPREELTGMPVIELVDESDRDLVTEHIRKRMAGEIVVSRYVARGRRKDGALVYLDVQGAPIEWKGQTAIFTTLLDITERRRADDAVQQARRYAEDLIETANVMIVGLDAAGTIQVFNKAAEELTGYQRSELAGRNWFEILVPKDRYPYVWDEFKRLLSGGLPATMENPILTKSGQERLISWRNSELRDHGKTVGTISFGIDLTERKRAEETLRESEAKMRALFAAMTDVILVLDAEGKYLEIAPTNPSLLYRPAPELLGRTLHEVFPVAEADFFLSEVRQALRTGQPVPVEYRLSIEGHDVWFAATVSPLRPGTVLWVARDITARKQAETLLREQTERLQEQAELLDLAQILVQDMEHHVVLWNTGTERLYGFTREQAVGHVSHELLQTEFPEPLPKIMEELRRTGRWEGEVHHTTRDGRRIAVASLWVLHHDADRQPTHILEVNSDITGLKEAERTLHELSGRLLRLQDDERRRIARELHDTTSQNLAALAMNLSLLRHALPEPEPKVDRLLTDCGNLANRCTQEIRTLSYLLHPPALDMMGLPGALREYVEGFGRRSGIVIDFSAAEDFGRLPAAVETALFRVVQEALGNVHRHSGSLTARVNLHRQGPDVVVEITDMGRGIPAQKLISFNEGAAVLGVGLAGMRERLRQLGGRLEIESSASGTRVRALVTVEHGPIAKAE